MAQVELEDTPLHRDAAIEEIFRARADTLLASSEDPRTPKLTGERAAERQSIVADAGLPPPHPAVLWAEEKPVAQAAVEPGILPEPPVVPVEPVDVQQLMSQTKPPKPKTSRKDLPLSGFDAELENLISNKKNEWEDDTASDVRVLVGIFRGILEELVWRIPARSRRSTSPRFASTSITSCLYMVAVRACVRFRLLRCESRANGAPTRLQPKARRSNSDSSVQRSAGVSAISTIS